MIDSKPGAPVERMFPFVLRSRALIIGRDLLARSKSRLHFILVTTDLSPASLQSVLSDFAAYPVVQHFTSGDLEKHFQVKDLRVVGFRKSGLSQSIYAELKVFRLNRPAVKTVDESHGLSKSSTHGRRQKTDRAGDPL